MERALAGGRIVEQVVSPLTSSVAGFRFDAPAAIRYAAKYTVSALNEARTTAETLACCLDESHVSPATLRIRVTVVQVSPLFHHPMYSLLYTSIPVRVVIVVCIEVSIVW